MTTIEQSNTTAAAIAWDPPAGGHWELETIHVMGGQPRFFQERAPAAFKAGFQAIGRRYGLPIDYLDMRFVNDHCYARMRPVGAPEPKPGRASAPPPPLVLKALCRLHPELRRRTKTAKRVLAERSWHRDLERWQGHLRDEMLAAGRSLQAVPLESLDDEALVDHLAQVGDHFDRGCALHFEMLPVHNISVGRLLLAGRRWGLEDDALFQLLAGSSPASRGSAAGLARIAAACATAGVDPESLDDVRAASPAAAAALDDYLVDHAWRIVTQYTPRGLALIEMPEVIVQAIRAAGRGDGGEDRAAGAEPDAEPLRERVPEADRAEFDELLADARRGYGIRDDNVALTFVWPIGLMRRALLEVGRRLVERGLIEDPEHVLTLGEADLAAALRGDEAMAAAAGDRAARLLAYEADGAPLLLGDDEGPPPDPSLFPAAMAEITGALLVGFELELAGPDREDEGGRTDAGENADNADKEWTGHGIGIGTEPYAGRACVAPSPEDALARLQPGDILVTTLTTPAFEAVMPIAGAVVTEHGGLMGHTAIVCREYGIPAVVGAVGATEAIADGASVVVDPASGVVRITAAEPAPA